VEHDAAGGIALRVAVPGDMRPLFENDDTARETLGQFASQNSPRKAGSNDEVLRRARVQEKPW